MITPLDTPKKVFDVIFRCFTSSSDFCGPNYCLGLCPSTLILPSSSLPGSFLLWLGSPLCAVHALLMISAHQPFQAHILRTACHIMHLPFRTTGLFFKLLSNQTAWSVHLSTAQNRIRRGKTGQGLGYVLIGWVSCIMKLRDSSHLQPVCN